MWSQLFSYIKSELFFIIIVWLVQRQVGEGICLGGDFQLGAFNVRVDLRGVEIFVSEHLLQRFQINAVRKHQRRRRVAQLVRGELRSIQPRSKQMLFDEPVNRRDADSVAVA